MIPTEVIGRKRDGLAIPTADLTAFLHGYLAGGVPDYQMSAFLMAVFFRGLDDDEADTLVQTMLASGRTLDLAHLPGPRVDKHSTGGVGDKVSLALAPLAAALGLYVPMMSGRGLGHTTGTLDKLEAIPGFRTDLDLQRFSRVVEEVGCGMMGQSAEIAPLDKRLYALRDVTATVPVIPLIAASIMSKKLAEDLNALVLDVKVGSGAFMVSESDARALAVRMVRIGEQHGLRTRALLTAMDRPLGRAVGNGLETAEAIACLRGEGPADLRELVITQAAEMVRLAADGAVEAVPTEHDAAVRASDALASGAALQRFVRLVEAQGGDPSIVDSPERLASAPSKSDVRAKRSGVVLEVLPRPLGDAVVRLGGGRQRMDQEIDPGVGFEILARPGDEVGEGDLIAVVHARTEADGEVARAIVTRSVRIGERGETVVARPLVSERVG